MRWIKALGYLLLAVVILLGGLFAVGYLHHRQIAGTVFAVQDPPLTLPTDAASLAHGRHLFETRGCADCHGGGGEGKLVFDAGPVVRAVASNLTPSALRARGYDADRIAAAIRHGVRADGTPLIFMPAGDWHELGDADTAALVAYLQSLPDQAHDPGRSQLRPLGWVLNLLGQFPAYPASGLDHAPRPRSAPPVEVSVEYGRYLAQTCSGCHGSNFAGGQVHAPNTPATANLTPTALGSWSEADFLRAMREGRRPDGRAIDPFMPWPALGKMSDTELRALWAYLKQLPPV